MDVVWLFIFLCRNRLRSLIFFLSNLVLKNLGKFEYFFFFLSGQNDNKNEGMYLVLT